MHATWVMCSALETLAHVGVGAIRIVHVWAGREGRRCSQRHPMGVPNDLSKRGRAPTLGVEPNSTGCPDASAGDWFLVLSGKQHGWMRHILLKPELLAHMKAGGSALCDSV